MNLKLALVKGRLAKSPADILWPHARPIRRDHRRGRPQRAGDGGLPRSQRTQNPGARAAGRAGWCRRQRTSLAGLYRLDSFLRSLPDATRGHPRARVAPARPHALPACRRLLRAFSRWLSPAPDQKPGPGESRNRQILQERRGRMAGIQRIPGGDRPNRSAPPADDATGCWGQVASGPAGASPLRLAAQGSRREKHQRLRQGHDAVRSRTTR